MKEYEQKNTETELIEVVSKQNEYRSRANKLNEELSSIKNTTEEYRSYQFWEDFRNLFNQILPVLSSDDKIKIPIDELSEDLQKHLKDGNSDSSNWGSYELGRILTYKYRGYIDRGIRLSGFELYKLIYENDLSKYIKQKDKKLQADKREIFRKLREVIRKHGVNPVANIGGWRITYNGNDNPYDEEERTIIKEIPEKEVAYLEWAYDDDNLKLTKVKTDGIKIDVDSPHRVFLVNSKDEELNLEINLASLWDGRNRDLSNLFLAEQFKEDIKELVKKSKEKKLENSEKFKKLRDEIQKEFAYKLALNQI